MCMKEEGRCINNSNCRCAVGVRPRQKQEQKHNTYRPYRSQKRHRRAHLNFLQPLGSFLASLFFLGSCFLSASVLVQAQTPAEETAPTPLETTYDFTNISQCNLTTQELVALSNKDHVDPCIVFDIEPDRMHTIPYRTMTVTLVQVTPATSCRDARDGAVTSIEKLNQENDGRGIAIGFNKDYYIQFRLVSLIAGNADALGATQYGLQHSALLSAALEATKAQYIVGTCSFASSYEKQPALDYKTIVMAQVGPPGYYQDNNPYVFGAHINSDDYPIHTVRALGFRAAERNSTSRQPVRVIYRTQSEFFRSTCASAVVALKEFGFDNLIETSYDPDGDDDGDGDANAFDEDFLIKLADESCPPGSAEDPDFTPALFACVLSEQDILLERWRENGCRPSLIWLTAATWGWANDNPNVVPYMQGGGQWHPAFTYGDRFFQSGVHLLEYNEQQFGYYGTYDSVVSYAIPMIFAAHLENAYRVEDNPDPLTDFSSEEGYERLRRDLIMLNIDSIFGPVQFNEAQRNIGRGAAGTQWLPLNNDRSFRNALVSPFFQAEAEAVLPAASAQECNPGHYVNETLISSGSSLLQSKCSECPVDSYTAISNQQLQCNICPEGTSTGGLTGAKYCVKVNDNLLSKTILGFGYAAVCIVWVVSGCFMAWLYKHRNDPLVRISQVEFLFLICIGAIISSSTIIALSWQAGSSEHHRNGYNNDAAAASRACQAAPFLYTVGWGLMYGSLSAKSFRLHKVMSHPSMQRVTVTIWETLSFLFRILAIDLIIVIIWTTLYPLEYIRETTSVEVDDNITTINSAGGCGIAEGGPSIWTFVGPLIAVHAGLMISTNVILYKVRNINDRYQEHKYVALASIFVCELLVVGLPVLVAVGDNPVAIFSVISGVVALNDIGILCFVFIPKMKYQRKGIDEGVAVGETIMKDTHKKALNREHHRRSLSNLSQSHVSGISGASASTDDDCNGGQISRTNSRQLPDRKLSLCSLSFDSEDVIAEEPGEDNDIESCYVMRKAESVQTESPGSPETAPCGYEEDRKKDGDSNRAVFEHRKYDAILKENEDLRRELEEMKRRARHLHNGLSTELENLVE